MDGGGLSVCTRLNTFPLAPRLFSFPFFSAPSLFLSIFPGKPHQIFRALSSEQSLRLVWAQNQPIGKIPGILRVYLEKPGYTWKIPGVAGLASDFAPDQLSDSGKLASFQNGAPNTSVFPGNFRKRKVLGPLCFFFCLPEKYMQAKAGAGRVFAEFHHEVRPSNREVKKEIGAENTSSTTRAKIDSQT